LQHVLPAILTFIGVPPEGLMGRRNASRHVSFHQHHELFAATYTHKKRFI
jgi:hypothetical protein